MTGAAGRNATWVGSWTGALVVATAAALVFLGSLAGGFVYDDARFITDNAAVTRHDDWLSFFTDAATADPTVRTGIARPLRTTEFALDWSMFGNSPAAFRVHSLLWHVLAAVLLLLVMRRLLGDARAALVGALFWAVHPVQVESVAWISSRGDVAMGACSLAAVLFALRADGFGRDLAVSLAAAAAAMLFKETAIVLPLGVIVLRWTNFSRAPWWPYVAVAAAYAAYRLSVASTSHDVDFVLGGSAAGTFATMFRGFGFYLAETLLPAQSLDWYMSQSTSLADAPALAWLVVHAALVASAVRARTRSPLWTLAVAWFYVFLLPVSNWPFFLGIPTTERFLYLPLAGVALALGSALVPDTAAGGARSSGAVCRAAVCAALVATAALGASSALRTSMWRSNDAQWRAVLADHESPRAHQGLSWSDATEAVALREEVLRLPEGPERTEKTSRALALFEQSLEHAHRAIALWHAIEGRTRSESDRARIVEAQAGGVCGVLDRGGESLFHSENAIRIDEGREAKPHFDRAWTLLAMEFAPQAAASMRRAWEIGGSKPDAGEAEFLARAAAACEDRGLLSTAQAAWETALAASPAGPRREEARSRLDALRRRPHPVGADEVERAALARLDDELARVPRTCPAAR